LRYVEQAPPLAHELEQPAARVVVLLVGLEVPRELRDAGAQQRDLHLGGTGVPLGGAELLDDLGLLGTGAKTWQGFPGRKSAREYPPSHGGVNHPVM
jgi:hypothetical protein